MKKETIRKIKKIISTTAAAAAFGFGILLSGACLPFGVKGYAAANTEVSPSFIADNNVSIELIEEGESEDKKIPDNISMEFG